MLVRYDYIFLLCYLVANKINSKIMGLVWKALINYQFSFIQNKDKIKKKFFQKLLMILLLVSNTKKYSWLIKIDSKIKIEMLKLCLTFIAALMALGCHVNAQQPDTNFCAIKRKSNNLLELVLNLFDNVSFAIAQGAREMPKIPNDRYQALIERNSLTNFATEEIREFFDPFTNVAISSTKFDGTTIKTFSYYLFNELLIITSKLCWQCEKMLSL